jgi:UDP-N-acetylglucosamine--N-acetylmuramyl-(pentapeptide) pyrophosphoryl-undecaprenol N-acetylglucosamine transferase
MGGFAAGPVVLLAALLGIPTAIAEQNALAGRTNRVLGRFVARVFLSFPESAAAFSEGKVCVTGNPVRPELLREIQGVGPPRWRIDGRETFHLLVFGGSQGARGIDRTMREALPGLRALPFPLEVSHQAGAQQVEPLREAYAAAGIAHRVVPFIEEMAQAYRWAHLVVCRAGATSLAEITLFQRPSVLIPFPHAVDDHQDHNARVLESAGAAVVVGEEDLDGKRLVEIIGGLGGDPDLLFLMGAKAGELARPGAADLMAEECLALARREGKASRPPEDAGP